MCRRETLGVGRGKGEKGEGEEWGKEAARGLEPCEGREEGGGLSRDAIMFSRRGRTVVVVYAYLRDLA